MDLLRLLGRIPFPCGPAPELATTLRYFFSAVFQGIAALVGVLGMAYVYLLSSTRQAVRDLDETVRRETKNWDETLRAALNRGGYYEVVRERLKTERSVAVQQSSNAERNKLIVEQLQQIQDSYDRLLTEIETARRSFRSFVILGATNLTLALTGLVTLRSNRVTLAGGCVLAGAVFVLTVALILWLGFGITDFLKDIGLPRKQPPLEEND